MADAQAVVLVQPERQHQHQQQTQPHARGQHSHHQQPAQVTAIDAVMHVQGHRRKSRRPTIAVTERWERNFQMLQRYKDKFGNCEVSCKTGTEPDSEYPGLGKWVSAMRQAYKAELARQKAAQENTPLKVRRSHVSCYSRQHRIFCCFGCDYSV